MDNARLQSVFDVITDFLVAEPTAEEILKYHLPDDLQARVDALVERNGEGLLNFEEQQELYDFIRADEMIALLKAKTRLRLQGAKH